MHLEKSCGKKKVLIPCRGGRARTDGAKIRARETERLFLMAASRLCQWSDYLKTCDKVSQQPFLLQGATPKDVTLHRSLH